LRIFADESKQANYIFGACIVEARLLEGIRKTLNELVLPGQRSLHFGSESETRRKQLLQTMLSLPCRIVVVESDEKRSIEGRRIGLRQIISLANSLGSDHITIERDDSSYLSDSNLLRTEYLQRAAQGQRRFEILPRHQEPLLWIADGAAWSYQRGGKFRSKLLESGVEVIRA
jgi:hypothetical protein